MKKFLIEWETDYCDDFPERRGEYIIEAENEQEAANKFYLMSFSKAVIINITERNKTND